MAKHKHILIFCTPQGNLSVLTITELRHFKHFLKYITKSRKNTDIYTSGVQKINFVVLQHDIYSTFFVLMKAPPAKIKSTCCKVYFASTTAWCKLLILYFNELTCDL